MDRRERLNRLANNLETIAEFWANAAYFVEHVTELLERPPPSAPLRHGPPKPPPDGAGGPWAATHTILNPVEGLRLELIPVRATPVQGFNLELYTVGDSDRSSWMRLDNRLHLHGIPRPDAVLWDHSTERSKACVEPFSTPTFSYRQACENFTKGMRVRRIGWPQNSYLGFKMIQGMARPEAWLCVDDKPTLRVGNDDRNALDWVCVTDR